MVGYMIEPLWDTKRPTTNGHTATPPTAASARPAVLAKRRRSKKPFVIVAGLAALVVGISQCTGSAALAGLPDLATVQALDLKLTSSANGTIEAAQTVPLSFRGGGVITELSAKVGQLVRTGAVLASGDDASAKREVELRRAGLDEANAKVTSARVGSAATPADRAAAAAGLRQSQVQASASKTAAIEAAKVASDSSRLNAQLTQQADEQAATDRLQLEVENRRLDEQIAKRATALEKKDAAQLLLDASRQKVAVAVSTKAGLNDELTRQRQRIAELQATRDEAQRAYNLVVADDDRVRQAAQAATDPAFPFTWAKSAAVTTAEASLAAAERAVSTAEAATIGLQANIDRAGEALARTETELATALGRLETAVASLDGAQQAVDAANRTREQASITAGRSLQAAEVARQSATVTAARDEQSVESARQATVQADAATAATRAANRAKEVGGRPSDVAAAQAGVRSAQISLALAEDRLKDYRIVAPFDGVVTTVSAKLGEQTTASASVVTIMTTSGFRVRVGFPEVDAARIRSGNATTVTFDALPSEAVEGTVESVEPTATLVNGVSTYFVRVLLASTPDTIRVGMSANVKVLTQTRKGVVVVPLNAVAQNEAGDSIVTVVVETSETGVNTRPAVTSPTTRPGANSKTNPNPIKSVKGFDASGKQQKRTVQSVIVVLGDTADGQAEIVSGLAVGDTIEIAPAVSR